MLRESLIELYTRDLSKLKTEIGLYADEAKLWRVTGEAPNSAGNLYLHLIGNLNHFFGAVLAENGYERDRPAEFESKNIARDELLARLDGAIEVVRTTLQNLSDADLEKDYPEIHNGRTLKTLQMILHLSTHLNYHLGQINYHRRLLG